MKLSPAPSEKVPELVCALAPSWAAGETLILAHFSFQHFISGYVIPSCLKEREPTPDGSSHLVFVCHSFGLAYLAQNYHLIFVFIIITINIIMFSFNCTPPHPTLLSPVPGCVGVCGGVWGCVGVCGGVWGCVGLCGGCVGVCGYVWV